MKTLNRLTVVFMLSVVSACAVIPAAGPSANGVRGNPDVAVVNVTPELANKRKESQELEQSKNIQDALSVLDVAATTGEFLFAAGDVLHVSIWTISPWSGSDWTQGGNNLPAKVDVGEHVVSERGSIHLPYIGEVAIAGMSLNQAEHAVSDRYTSLGILQAPSAVISVVSTPGRSVIVTGAIGAPKIIPWTPSGVSLSSALTQALGDGTALSSGNEGKAGSETSNQVTIVRENKSTTLPIDVALSQQVALRPGDKVVVKKASVVRVSVIGGGVRNNGYFYFGHVPALSEVLATASGLDANFADSHAVFVMETGKDGSDPVIYDFSWNNISGVLSSHSFPIRDGDMIYVAEAPMVPVQRAANLLFQLTLPAQLLK